MLPTPLANIPRPVRIWCWTFLLILGMPSALFAADLQISDARMRLLPGDIPAAGYFTLTNTGETDNTLIGADSASFGNVTIHQSVSKNGVSSMQHVDQLTVAAGEQVEFAPGGYHLMLMKRKHPIAVGDEIEVTLLLGNGQRQNVKFRAGAPTTQ
ncbi:copper chaperone PCu(A)C [Vreelandella salicampi]|uniref:Copper chaperone PCu(A)C n=1 Tax=Vreelandella salicampi TaxID=1449798 RepID=A0A7Z0RT80_9GAMM|nr:copper chaperone PCu(A)C [Halomonas salicampi]NYS59376.1 copper chaperone PCu(A)C [Halomonas salicampi]